MAETFFSNSVIDPDFALLEHEPQNEPLDQLIIKVDPRCNLACDYCYVYSLGDNTWQDKPRNYMDETTTALLVSRSAEHAEATQQRRFAATFHGGEPLLAPPEYFEQTVLALRAGLRLGTLLSFSLQTNGTLLNQKYLDVFADNRIRVGLSMDGSEEANNRHRLYRHGGSSHDRIMKAVELLQKPQNKELFGGVLAVIDLQNNPVETYEALAKTGAPTLNFLLPNGNWDAGKRPAGKEQHMEAPYAEWLAEAFDHWFMSPRFRQVRIKMFDSMISLIAGGESQMEGIGLRPVREIVIANDGTIEKLDTLRSSFDGASATDMHLQDTSFSEVLRQPAFKMRTLGKAALATVCQDCAIVKKCGGGYEPHRFSSANGYMNPSIFCTDMQKLFAHVQRRMIEKATKLRSARTNLVIEAADSRNLSYPARII